MAEKSIEKTYQKKTQLEHILLRPDSYIGSIEHIEQQMWVKHPKEEKFVFKNISYVPGLYKIFDEIIVNAADNIQRDKKTTVIKVNIDIEQNQITVYNNGKGIPVTIHKEHKCYVPEMVFGHLLTSSNYNDQEKKVTGGRNGYGAKLANIFSKKFTIETADSAKGKLYRQEFKDNMKIIGEPKITDFSKDKFDYTQVIFEPDLKIFGMKNKLDKDIVSLFEKRVYDLAGCTSDKVKVYLNEKEIKNVKEFQSYVNLYFTDKQTQEQQRVYERVNERWEVCVLPFSDQFQQVSFVNSICTIRGGTHVDYIVSQIITKLLENIKKKHKGLDVKPGQIKQGIWVFIKCQIENPAFDSQTKETLTSKAQNFGSKCLFDEKFFKKVMTCGIVENIVDYLTERQTAQLKRNLGTSKKKSKLFGIPKLEDANLAGTKDSHKCTLILTEGDSAKSLAMSGIQVVGRDYYGVFPLKGKFLNVREASHKQMLENDEVSNLIKIMGLSLDKKYEDLNSLRYGSIMIMADQDHDGSHIKGLLINFLHHFWPSILMKFSNFLQEFVTPIIKVTEKRNKQQYSFFTIRDFELWHQKDKDLSQYQVKYYKGLGTSTAAEAKEYFKNIDKHRITFKYVDQLDDDAIVLAFSKSYADKRKDWLANYDKDAVVNHNIKELRYEDFINRELIHFSNADNLRSIPSAIDGLKPGQRKIMYACFKRKLKQEIKVAQLSGYVAEHSAYHHGEMSLQQTIVNMAQDFVGSNNLNFLMPIGQFGTRAMGGKDASSARYIFTNLTQLSRIVFNENDNPLLDYITEEGQRIEPDYYIPIIPMVLVNGAEGIGTGWSTNIPCFNPLDIVKNIRNRLNGTNGGNFFRMIPWYKGYQGYLEPNADRTSYSVNGRYKVIDNETLEIYELPLKKWTRDYKNFLEELAIQEEIDDIKEFHKDNKISFIIKVSFDLKRMQIEDGAIEKKFKLASNLSCNNFVLFDRNYRIRRYENEITILEEFYEVRYSYYQKRKDFLTKKLTREYETLSNKYSFISKISNKELNVLGKKKHEIINILKQEGFKSRQQLDSIVGDLLKNMEQEQNKNKQENDQDESDQEEENGLQPDYKYLLKLSVFSMTYERSERLKQEMERKEEELNRIKKMPVEDLWLDDLELFENVYKKIGGYKESNDRGSDVTDVPMKFEEQKNISVKMPNSDHRTIVKKEQSEKVKGSLKEEEKLNGLSSLSHRKVIKTNKKDDDLKSVKSFKTEKSVKSNLSKKQPQSGIKKRRRVDDESDQEESSANSQSSDSEFEDASNDKSKKSNTQKPNKRARTIIKPKQEPNDKKSKNSKRKNSSESGQSSSSMSDNWSSDSDQEVIKKHVTSTRGGERSEVKSESKKEDHKTSQQSDKKRLVKNEEKRDNKLNKIIKQENQKDNSKEKKTDRKKLKNNKSQSQSDISSEESESDKEVIKKYSSRTRGVIGQESPIKKEQLSSKLSQDTEMKDKSSIKPSNIKTQEVPQKLDKNQIKPTEISKTEEKKIQSSNSNKTQLTTDQKNLDKKQVTNTEISTSRISNEKKKDEELLFGGGNKDVASKIKQATLSMIFNQKQPEKNQKKEVKESPKKIDENDALKSLVDVPLAQRLGMNKEKIEQIMGQSTQNHQQDQDNKDFFKSLAQQNETIDDEEDEILPRSNKKNKILVIDDSD